MSAIITYPDTENRQADTSKITLDKILQAINGGGGSGGSGSSGLQVLYTSGDPEGVLTATTTATRGAVAYDPATHSVWTKDTVGTSNTGWFQILGP